MFPQFPYTNLHELNLDWIIEQLQRTMNFAVLSVNGQTGDVVLYTDPNVEFPAIDSADWQIIRTANGRTVGIMFQNDKMYLRYGDTLSEVYSAANPPAYPVSSVNGQTGAVVTYPEAAVRLPDVDDAYTNIRRQIDSSGSPAIVGIEVDKTKAVRMNGTLRKTIYDEDNQPPYPVTSVNGQTGAIVIAVPIEPLSIDQSLWQAAEDSPNHTAGFSRFTLDGNVSIYLTSDSSKVEAYIDYLSTDEQTSYTRKLLTTDDIPSAAGVVSINGMNGVVTLYGTAISMSSLDSRYLTNIISGLEADVPGIGESVAWYEPGNTASQNIRKGDYVIWNNGAYRASSNIFSGDPLSGAVLDGLVGGFANNIKTLRETHSEIVDIYTDEDYTDVHYIFTNTYATPPEVEITIGTGTGTRANVPIAVITNISTTSVYIRVWKQYGVANTTGHTVMANPQLNIRVYA